MVVIARKFSIAHGIVQKLPVETVGTVYHGGKFSLIDHYAARNAVKLFIGQFGFVFHKYSLSARKIAVARAALKREMSTRSAVVISPH